MPLSIFTNSIHLPMNLALGFPMGPEWIVIAALGLLIWGKRLPEVGRSLGKGIVEFKKGLKGVEEEIDEASEPARPEPEHRFDPYTGKPKSLPPTYKFDPYTGKPIDQGADSASKPESEKVG